VISHNAVKPDCSVAEFDKGSNYGSGLDEEEVIRLVQTIVCII